MGRAPLQLGRGKVERRAREAEEDTAVVFCRIENPELQAQREIVERLSRVIEQSQPAVAVADHLTIEVEHAAPAGPGEPPLREGRGRAVEQRTEPRLRLRTDDRLGAGE